MTLLAFVVVSLYEIYLVQFDIRSLYDSVSLCGGLLVRDIFGSV